MKRGRVGFLKPREDDDLGSGYQEDRPDLDTNSQTTFVYNPYQVNPQHSCHSPSCEWQSSSESGHWQTESSPSYCRLQRQPALPAGDSSGEFEGQLPDDSKRLIAARRWWWWGRRAVASPPSCPSTCRRRATLPRPARWSVWRSLGGSRWPAWRPEWRRRREWGWGRVSATASGDWHDIWHLTSDIWRVLLGLMRISPASTPRSSSSRREFWSGKWWETLCWVTTLSSCWMRWHVQRLFWLQSMCSPGPWEDGPDWHHHGAPEENSEEKERSQADNLLCHCGCRVHQRLLQSW